MEKFFPFGAVASFMERWRWSLRLKIMLAILGAGGVVLSVGILSVYLGAKEALRTTMGHSFQAHAREAAQKVQFLVEKELEDARMLAGTDWALTAARGGKPSRDAERSEGSRL